MRGIGESGRERIGGRIKAVDFPEGKWSGARERDRVTVTIITIITIITITTIILTTIAIVEEMQAMEHQSTGTGTSIRERMALLQLDQVARNAPRGPIPPPPPPRQPPRPPLPSRASTSSFKSTSTSTSTSTTTPSTPRRQIPPPLPTRKTSRSSIAESFVSVASTSSTNSSGSTSTTRSLPPLYTGKESLPFQFPDKKPEPEPPKRVNSLPPNNHLPRGDSGRKAPPLPVRRTTTATTITTTTTTTTTTIHPLPSRRGENPVLPTRRLPPLPARSVENAPSVPTRSSAPNSHTCSEGPPPIPRGTRPPPVPISSRPTARVALSESPLPCLSCYDFSGPDRHAGLPQFHRSRVTSLSSLAIALTEPFPSALDKARVLFTWLHHNVSYDVTSFFNNAIPTQDPESTLRSGLAVCAGYAELFATLALHSGLEAIVVGGHGKGYGHSENPGAPPPPYEGNHAWNAVKLAPNYWHLIDSCWGAGHIQGPPTSTYTAALSTENFTSPPSIFGRSHFPQQPQLQHREDGRVLTWAEYIAPATEAPKCYVQFTDLFKFSKETLLPATRRITGGRTERFVVTLPCLHLPPIMPRDEYVFFLNVGAEFGVENFYVLVPDGTGRGYECVVELPKESDLKVTMYYVREFDGRQGRGLGSDYFLKKVGKCGWGWCPVVEWGGTG